MAKSYLPESKKKIRIPAMTVLPKTKIVFDKTAKALKLNMSCLMDFLAEAVNVLRKTKNFKRAVVSYRTLKEENAEMRREFFRKALEKSASERPWSLVADKCVDCNETSRKHVTGGLCSRCYMRMKWRKQHGK